MQYQMPPELTKEERAMLNELPPLPPSDYTDNGGFGQDRALALFTGSQMRSYALEAVRAEQRETYNALTHAAFIIKCLRDGIDIGEKLPDGLARIEQMRERCATAIRSGKP